MLYLHAFQPKVPIQLIVVLFVAVCVLCRPVVGLFGSVKSNTLGGVGRSGRLCVRSSLAVLTLGGFGVLVFIVTHVRKAQLPSCRVPPRVLHLRPLLGAVGARGGR